MSEKISGRKDCTFFMSDKTESVYGMIEGIVSLNEGDFFISPDNTLLRIVRKVYYLKRNIMVYYGGI